MRGRELVHARMRKLPVVPICRTTWPLRCRANQNEHPRVPPSIRGTLRDRHERWKRDAVDAASHETNEMIADGEVVWFWRPKAGVKLVMMLRITLMTVTTKPGHRGDHV